MLRTIFTIGLFALLGLFVLQILFKILPAFFGLLWWLLVQALWIALIGLVVYLVIRIFSPDTARRLREKFSGTRF